MITKDGLAFAKNAAIGTLFCSGIFQSIAAVTPKSRYRTPDLIKLSWNCFGTICDIMTLPIAPKPAKNAVAIKNANNHSSICAVVNIVKLPFFFSLAKHPLFAEAALQGLYSNCLYVSLLNSWSYSSGAGTETEWNAEADSFACCTIAGSIQFLSNPIWYLFTVSGKMPLDCKNDTAIG